MNAKESANRFLLRVTMHLGYKIKKEHEDILFFLDLNPKADWDCCCGDEGFTRNLCLGLFSEACWYPSCTALPAVETAYNLKAINLWLNSIPQKGCAWSCMIRCSSDLVPLPKPLVLSFSDWQEQNGSPRPEGKSY